MTRSFEFNKPLHVKRGQYFGLTTVDSGELNICSVAEDKTDASERAEREATSLYYHSMGYSKKDESRKLTVWKGSLAIAILIRGLGILGPQWRNCRSEIKGWGVNTAILDKGMDFDGQVTQFKIRHFKDCGAKGFKIYAFDKKSQANTFQTVGSGFAIADYVARSKHQTVVDVKPPLQFRRGQYLGLTSTSTSLNICSIAKSAFNADELAERETTHVFHGRGFSGPNEKKTLNRWEGNVAIGFEFGATGINVSDRVIIDMSHYFEIIFYNLPYLPVF